jgi:hypothetical protein
LDFRTRAMEFFCYKNAVSALDGDSTVEGVWRYTLIAGDSSLALVTPHTGEFRLYATGNPSDKWDSTTCVASIASGAIQSTDIDTAACRRLRDTVWQSPSRTLTALDEDGTTIDLDGSYVMADVHYWNTAEVGNLNNGRVPSYVTACSTNVIGSTALHGAAALEIADSLLHRDRASAVLGDAWTIGNLLRGIGDTINTHAPHGDDWASTGTGGNGAIPCTLAVRTASGGVALQGVFVRIYNSDETATAAAGTTDADGQLIVTLEAAAYHAYAYQGGYVLPDQPVTVTVTPGGANDTLWAIPFDPGSPATADLCRVYGWVSDLSGGTVDDATVHARVNEAPLRYQNMVISPYERSTSTDSTGYWYLDLFPSDVLTPGSTRYEFEIRLESGAVLRKRVSVPDSVQWMLTW